jgi:hypothetical protein
LALPCRAQMANTGVTYSANGGQWVDDKNYAPNDVKVGTQSAALIATDKAPVKPIHNGFSMTTFMRMNADAERQADQQLHKAHAPASS